MIGIKLTVSGIDRVEEMLTKIKIILADVEPELILAGSYLLHFLSVDVFESQGAIYGEVWQPLSYSYYLQKIKKYPGRGILEASGEMRRAYTLSTGPRNAVIENPTPYAIYHQEGRGRNPKRPLALTEGPHIQKIQEIFATSLRERIHATI